MKLPRTGCYLPTLCRESEPLSLMAQKDMRQEEAVLAAYQGYSARPHLSCTPISPDQLLGFSSPKAVFCLLPPWLPFDSHPCVISRVSTLCPVQLGSPGTPEQTTLPD